MRRPRRFVAIRIACLLGLVAGLMFEGGAQAPPGTSGASDPRVGLPAGFRDAGQAVRHLRLVASVPKPEGFFDPQAPAGVPMPPERDQPTPDRDPDDALAAAPAAAEPQAARGAERPPEDPARASRLNFANSDLAFSRNRVFLGSFHGFNTFDVDSTARPRLLAAVVCPGGQGDVSVYGHLLFMSVEQTRARVDCGLQGVKEPVSPERFRGIRIFDISDLARPKQVAAVQTCRGSHTHTLVPDPRDPSVIYVYGSGTAAVRSAEELPGCSGLKPEEDPNTALYSIDVIRVPLAAPGEARIVNRPRIFADPATGAIAGLWPGGSHGPGTQTTRATNQCHDITVFPEVGLAAGACAGNGILLDISDPVHPVRIDQVTDKNFAYWHSATFNNDGTKVIFTDEWGGGTRPRCRSGDPPAWGADAIFDIVDRKLVFRSYYKLPAPQTEQENCVAHNGSMIPVPGRDIMVQGWYQGGVTVFDFTDSARPVEIAFFDRGPIDPERLIVGGYWAAYWFNGYIYASEIARGLDIFELTPSEHLSANEIAAAGLVRLDEFNPQVQRRITWPPRTVVALAYLDQLGRTNGIAPSRAAAVRAALGRADRTRAGERTAREVAAQLEALARGLAEEAPAAAPLDRQRLRALAALLEARAAALR